MKQLYPLDHALAARLATRHRALRWSQDRLALEADLSEGLVAKPETLWVPYSPDHLRAMDAALARAVAGSLPVRAAVAAWAR